MVLGKRQYKNYSEESFLQDLKNGLSNDSICSYFNNDFKETLDHHAPTKKTELCGNKKLHINKTLSKEIM